ncbi:MAG TPA: hypothetical protein VMO78_18890 [Rhizomicrobium sp.]|nr:hypothetical protein [Rhizomicrobium sp.]
MKSAGNIQDPLSKVSRRALFGRVVVAGAGSALLLGTALPAEAKMAQKDAGYQQMPKGDQSCSNCSLFIAPDSCPLVDGPINPQGWCRYHQNKS